MDISTLIFLREKKKQTTLLLCFSPANAFILLDETSFRTYTHTHAPTPKTHHIALCNASQTKQQPANHFTILFTNPSLKRSIFFWLCFPFWWHSMEKINSTFFFFLYLDRTQNLCFVSLLALFLVHNKTRYNYVCLGQN